jgi:uncharacterized membrane protein
MAAAGGLLAYAGMKLNSNTEPGVAETSLLLNTSPDEAYRFWREFETIPQYMSHIESVNKIADRTYRFIARVPVIGQVRWDAELYTDRQSEGIDWRSLPGSDVDAEGSVRFRKAADDRGTIVTSTVRFRPAAGGLAGAARYLSKSASFLLRQNLRRAKALVETGEIPTTEGQSHGPRSVVTGVMRSINPVKPARGEHGFQEMVEARRSVS